MERNQRVVKSFLEENLNQYFTTQRGLSCGNVEISAVQSRDPEIVRHSQDNKYGRYFPSSEYNNHYGRTSQENSEQQQPLYYRRDDIQFGSSTERNGIRNNDTPYGSNDDSSENSRNRNSDELAAARFSTCNDDINNGDHYGINCDRRNDGQPSNFYRNNFDHNQGNKSGRSFPSSEYNKHYGGTSRENSEQQPLYYRRDDIQFGSSTEKNGKRINDTPYGSNDRANSRNSNSDAPAADRVSNYNDDINNGDHHGISCYPRNDDGPPSNYFRNNFDPFSSNNLRNGSPANRNRLTNNTVGNIGSNNVNRFECNNHAARNDFSNEIMNNGCFRIDYRSGNNRFNVSRNNDHPESNSYSGNNYFRINKQKYKYTNVSVLTTPTFTKKHPYEFQERGDYNKSARIVHTVSSFNSSTNNVSATLPSTLVNVTIKKTKDVQHSARRINASIRAKNEKYMNADVEVQKVKRGNSKADPEKYWKAWWPKYSYIEKSIQIFDDEDMKSLEPFIKFIYKPSDSNFINRKQILLRQGVNKINRNMDITESNYQARDVIKLFVYSKQLSDPDFHQYLQEDELRNVTNAVNTGKEKVKFALLLQNMIHKWHAFTEILERRKNGEDIPGRHAENTMNDTLFHYLVSDCIKELKQICSGEWPGFDKFYNSL